VHRCKSARAHYIVHLARDDSNMTAEQLVHLKQDRSHDRQSTVNAHLRLLEALRRTGVVDRMANGVWKIPPDLMRKAQQHDVRKASGHVIELLSHLPLEEQVRAIGATWLDRNLVAATGVANQGFGAQTRDAVQARVNSL